MEEHSKNEFVLTFIEEYEGGVEQLKKDHFKNAVILLSKSAFALCDFLIFEKLNKFPKNHNERFRILEEYFSDVYKIMDSAFENYTDAYSKSISKETCIKIKNGVNQIAKTRNFPEEIKKIIE